MQRPAIFIISWVIAAVIQNLRRFIPVDCTPHKSLGIKGCNYTRLSKKTGNKFLNRNNPHHPDIQSPSK
jgi:hypothetical protein